MRALVAWAQLVEAASRQPLSRSIYGLRLLAVASAALVVGGWWLLEHASPVTGEIFLGIGLLVGAVYSVQWAAARRERGKDPAEILPVFLILVYLALVSFFWVLTFASVIDPTVIYQSSLAEGIFWVIVMAPLAALLVLCIAISRRSKRIR